MGRRSTSEAAAAAYRRLTGRFPDGMWRAPGRVTVIGEHTDYSGGLALPVAIDRAAHVAAGLRRDGVVRCVSEQMDGMVAVRVSAIEPGGFDAGWAAHPLGTVWALRRAGLDVPGVDLVIDSDIPVGGGLASSAALEVGTALAVTELTSQAISTLDLARCCMDGEHAIAGAPTGIMDQVAVLEARAGHAVLLDCRTMSRELVPFAPDQSGLRLMLIDSVVEHANRASGYRTRRQEAGAAAAAMSLEWLRDASLDGIAAGLTGVLLRRARHVVTENARVVAMVAALGAGRLDEAGRLLDAGHASLRDDYEVSCAELDVAVEAARAGGAIGARMTGGGFGGCAIALVPADRVDGVAAAVAGAFATRGFGAPAVFPVDTADGARRVA